MRYRSEASERVLKGVAAVDAILDGLRILQRTGLLDRAAFCNDSARWMGVKATLLRSTGWHREAMVCERGIAELFAHPTFQPPAEHPAPEPT